MPKNDKIKLSLKTMTMPFSQNTRHLQHLHLVFVIPNWLTSSGKKYIISF